MRQRKKVTPHLLRHSFGRWALNAGIDIILKSCSSLPRRGAGGSPCDYGAPPPHSRARSQATRAASQKKRQIKMNRWSNKHIFFRCILCLMKLFYIAFIPTDQVRANPLTDRSIN